MVTGAGGPGEWSLENDRWRRRTWRLEDLAHGGPGAWSHELDGCASWMDAPGAGCEKSWTRAFGAGRWSTSFIVKATDLTRALGNPRITFGMLRKLSPSSIYVIRIVRLPRTYPPTPQLVAATKTFGARTRS